MYDQTAGAPEPDDFDLMDDAALDALLEQRLNDRAGAAQERTDTLRPVDDDLPAPLSFGQERLWFLDRYESGGIEYNSAVGLHLRGELDTAALTAALGRLVERHEPLRTTFAVVDGRPRQVVRPAAPVDLDVRDLTDLPERDRPARADDLLRAELGRPFDLVEGPLLRAVLLRLGATEHTLLVNMHHIAADGWSKGVFARELGVFYADADADAAQGRDGGLPPLPARYRDYAAWQREQLTDDRLESELAYWKGTLADVEPLELPTDRPRPAVRTTNGALAPFRVPAEVGRALADLGKRHDGTLFSVLVAATQVLLARYSRQRDIAVGTVSMGRERSELEPLVGFFVNTLVLRSEVDADLPFTEFLGRVTDTVWDALAHQDLPFDRLVDALRIERDPSRTPLVQAAVVLQNTPAGEVELPGLDVTEFRPPSVSSIFDLTLEFAETASGELTGTVEYNTDLFDAGTMARFTGHLGELLAGIAADPARPVGDLPLLTAEEDHLLAREWGDNRIPYPADATVHGLVADRARSGPDAVAVDGPAGRLSYRELEERANRLARHLVARGAEPGGHVAVCLPRGADFYVALLAVLKAGCAYVPLDPDHPAERLAHILDDTRAPLCLTDRDLAGRLPAGRTGTVLLDEEAEAIAALPQDDPGVAVGPGDAAYVLYTSGSTGTPKGVVVEHRSIVRLVSGNDYAPLHPDDVVAQAADVTFDAATFEIWGALTAGARIVPVDRETLLDARALTAAIDRLGVTTMWLTAGLFDQVAAVDPAAFGKLRNLLFGGDAVNPRRVAQVLAAAPPQRLVNGYGPTETTTFATWHHVVEGDGTTPVPIGRPIANTSVHVLDERRSRVPVGVPGELYIGGPGVARGYLNLPELTEERFCADPYSDTPQARLYRTGDLVRWRSDGTLEFLGRTDHQVKVRGYRIEPGEIESVLEQHPAVSAAVVTVRQDGGRKQLVGYVRQSDGGQVDPAGLRAFAESRLPGYLVPSALVVLAEFPLTASGKLDRRALPAPTEQHTPGADFTAPAGEAEQALARVWTEVLGIERVGTRDNFFDLGGDSILSIQVVAKARQAGWELTSKDVFARQTVAELARAAVPVTAAVDTAPVTGEAPLTPVQRWFFAHHTRAPHHFNQSVLLTLAPGTDERALAEALRAVVTHHDALRMRFPGRGAALRQVNLPVGEDIALERVDLGHLAAGERRDAEAALAEQAQAGLDVEDGPLLRAVLFAGAPDEPSRLFLTVHHLVVDGVSWRILLDDLERAVSQAAAGRPVDLGAKTTSFLDWARRLAGHVADGGFDAEADHWREVAALPAAALPVDRDGENTMAAVREVRAGLDAEATDALLRQVPAVYRTQVNDILLAALGRTLCRWTGEEQVVVDLEGHGREEILDGVDVSRTAGWFTSIFPVLLSAPHGAGAGDLIKSVKEGLRAVPQRGIGYGGLRYPADGPSALPECAPAVSFNYLGQWQDVADDGLYAAVEFDFGRDHSPLELRPHLLDIVGEVRGGRLEFTLHYASDVHDEATVRALADGLVDAVRALIGHCLRPGVGGATPSDFPLAGLDQAAVDRLVGSGDRVEDVYPLTPMQSGMLFHALTEPDGAYLDHVSFLLEGAGDTDALGTAWQRVVEATPALRTHLVWEGVDRPLQVVRSDVRPDVRTLDWRGLDEKERARLLTELTAQERRAGLDLAAGPLSRVVLAREADDATRVVWTFHHVVLDGWSISRILGDLFAHYRALADGTAVPEDTLRARPPFRDYVQWLARQDAAAAEGHWRRVLAGLTSPTPLPYDRRPAPGHQSEAADRIRVELAPEDCAALSERARGHRLTLNTMVQGAWALLLSRYSGEEDVCFGSTVAGRPADLPGVSEMVGNFLNTIPVRTRAAKDQDVLAWLRQLQDEQVEARGYEYSPLTQVQAASELPRGTRLFDSIVVFENYPGNGQAAAEHGLAVTGVTAVDTTSYPLDLTAYLDGDRLALQLAYDAALFDGERVSRMADHLAELLRGMAHGPDRTVAELPMLPERERELLLGGLSGSTLPFDRDTCLHQLIARQARRVPDNDAVVFGGATLSYAELDEMADRLAQELAARGVGAGSVVAICVERGLHMVVALLGVLKAGGAYLPLDPAHPADRLEYVLADSAAALVITQSAVAGRIPGEVPLLRLDEEWPRIARLPARTPDSGVTPGHPAYLIYTSGSTGRPKGVLVEHRSVAFAAESWKLVYRTGEEPPARQLNVASMSFDVFVSDLAHVLCHGGALVIAPAEATTEPGQLLDLMHSARVTHLETVPSLANALVEEAERRGTGLPPLRFLAVGSDNWRTQDCRRLLAQTAEGTVVLNSYGVTEATVESCAYVVHADRLPDGPGVPVGQAIPGVRTYVLDEAGRPVPAGVVGELYLGGPGVARGYLNRPELTEERFLPDPFSAEPGARLYRTGDMVRRRADGDIEFAGRADDQVKIRGFRIELAEVEAALRRHPAVADAVVAARTDGGTPARLVGYAVTAAGHPFAAAELRAHLEDVLPRYMVPAVLVELAALPLNSNGKVDRRALPAPAPEAARGSGHLAPRNPVEEALAEVWAQVLRVDRVGVEDNFFDLGGDSILSIQVVTRARQKGITLSSKDLFAHQTVAELAFATTAADPAGKTVETRRSEPAVGRVPLTPIQRTFFDRHRVAPHHSTMSVLVTLSGAPDTAALRRALDALLDHHDQLRARYTSAYGRWQQEVTAPGAGWPLEEVDLAGHDAPEEEMHRAATAAQAGFDLAAGRPVAAVLFHPGEGRDHQLFLTAHHLVVDAVSWQLLLTDLETAYAQAAAGRTVDLGERTTSFRDWALRLSEHTAAGGFDGELDHWVATGRRAEAALPVDRPGEATIASAGEVRVTVGEEDTRALLHDVPATYRTQVNDVLLTALGTALADWTGRGSVLFDLEGHGREDLFDDVDTSRTAGWFTSAFPVALTPSGADWGERLKQVKEQLRAVPGRGIGYGALRHLSPAGSPAEILAEAPSAQVCFNYLGQEDEPAADGGLVRGARLGFGTEQAPEETLEYLLDVVAQVRAGRLEISLYHSSAVHDTATVERFGERLVAALRGIVAHCAEAGTGGATPSDFPLAKVDQTTLDQLTAHGGRIDDLYPLTPMQGGLLFHSLSEPGESIYLGHLSFVLDGVDDLNALAEAWQLLTDRNAILRTAAVWENVDDPLQVVYHDVRMPVQLLDWTGLTEAERAESFERLLDEERARSMDLTVAPLSRVVLIAETERSVRTVWTSHHVLLDGWSSADLLAELLEHYLRVRGLKDGPLPARRPFRDYVAWLDRQDPRAAERHWRGVLEGHTEPTPLPVDHDLPGTEWTGSRARISFQFEQETSDLLAELIKRHRLTVNTLAQGAWALLLSRYSGRTDVCFGSAVSGRPADLPGVETIAGIFINNIPVRTRVTPESRLLDWLAELQREQTEARSHEFVSLSQIRGWAQVQAGTSLYDSYIVVENYPYEGEMGAEYGVSLRDPQAMEFTNFPMVLAVFPAGRLAFRLAYDPVLFEPETAERVLNDLRAVLEEIAREPERTLGRLGELSAEHRQEAITAHQGPRIAFDDRPVHLQFAEQAERTPQAVAVADREGRLTFAELDAAANRLAHHLAERGVGAQTPVAVLLERGTDLVTALLAVLKAGGTYSPVDPAAPAERLALLLEDTAAPVVITHAALRERLPRGATVVTLDEEREAIVARPGTAPSSAVSPDDAAYVIHTSGSTGRPKGVVVEHRSLANLLDSHRRTVFGPVRETAQGRPVRVAHLAPASFDASWNPVLWLVDGNELHIVDDTTRRDAQALADYVVEHGVEFLQTTPSYVQQLFDTGLLERPGLRLRGLALGGEPIGQALWDQLRARPELVSFNFYGPTECTVDAVITRLADSTRPVLGLPVQNTRAYVLDEELKLLPVGAPGELCLAGAGLAREYLGRPELTERAFVRAPFGSGERLYRTGDRVRRLPDGTLEYLGRLDHQIKLRGYRIEPGEIEYALAGHPGVEEAVVAVLGEGEARRLAGYVRVADPAAFDAEAVTGHLAERLPDYMVPPVLVPLAQFPLNPNGKVDRKALLETGTPQAEGSGYVEPRTDTEKALAKIWADVLEVDRVGAHDNFFSLGGHSILSLKTLSQIKRAFGVRPTFRELLDTPTLAGFAELIEETLLRELEKAAAADAGAGDADTERKA